MHVNNQQDTKEAKQCWRNIWKQKEHSRNAEWVNNIEKESQRFEEGSKADVDQQSFSVTVKKSTELKNANP